MRVGDRIKVIDQEIYGVIVYDYGIYLYSESLKFIDLNRGD